MPAAPRTRASLTTRLPPPTSLLAICRINKQINRHLAGDSVITVAGIMFGPDLADLAILHSALPKFLKGSDHALIILADIFKSLHGAEMAAG